MRWRSLLCLALMPCSAQAERVVTLSPHLAELVCAAGACDQLAGVVAYSDFPPAVLTRPQVGDAFAVNAEAVLALAPTLILSWDGGTPAATTAQLQRLGLRVQAIRVATLADIEQALLRIGALLGTEDTACVAAADFRQRIDTLRARHVGAAPLRVMYQMEAEPVFTVGQRSPISEAMQVCGGINVFAGLDAIAGAVTREAVLAAQPDLILFGRQDDAAGIRRGWSRFTQWPVVRDGHLYSVDQDRLARATPRMAEGMAELCAVLDRVRAGAAKP